MLEKMKSLRPRQLQVVAWTVSITAAVLAIIAWGQGNNWKLAGISTYQIFPVFGLLAFSLMWSHYIAVAARLYFKIDKGVLSKYFEFTSLAVLAAILLHPGLLAWQAWRDGLGLPPGSEIHYVAPMLGVYVVLGIIALTVFLAYEFRRKFGDRPWWKYVSYASDGAMFLILIHSLKLGSQLQAGWFRTVWYFYGITLLGCLVYIYSQKAKTKPIGQN